MLVELYMRKLDPDTFRVGSLQFLFFAAFGTMVPFFSIYYRSILQIPGGGPDYSAIGIVLFLQSSAGIISPLFFGFLADKFKIENRLVTICAAVVSGAGLMIAIPSLYQLEVPISLSFPTVFLITGIGAFIVGSFSKPLIPLIDTETLKTLRRLEGNTERYGKIRQFGSVGFVITCTFIGWIMRRFGILTFNIIGFAFLFLVLAITASTGFKSKIQAVSIPWKLLFEDKLYRRFLLFTLVMSVGMSGSFMFTGVFMEDAGLDFFSMGIAFALAALIEVPVMSNAGKLLHRFGNRWMVRFGVGMLIVKLIGFTLIADGAHPALFIAINCVFQGLGFSIMFLGFIDFMERQAHQDLKATYQNLYHLTSAVGSSIGNFTASYVIGATSSQFMMAASAGVMFLSLLYFMVRVR